MNEEHSNDYHWYFVKNNGEKEKYKPKRKRKKSFVSQVIQYLFDEWGVNTNVLNDQALSNMVEHIEMLQGEGYNIPNVAGFVMEWAWQHGLERPNFE